MPRYNIFFLLLSIFLLSYLVGCGSTNETQKPQKEQAMQEIIGKINSILEADSMSVRKMPKLKGSRREFQSNVKYPESCREANAEGTVIVQFTVTKTGALTDFEVLQGIGWGCDEAAIQALKRHAEFTPGIKDGKPVNVQMAFPIAFRLQ